MYRKHLVFFTVVLFCVSFFAFSQDSEWYYNKTIKRIYFEGLVSVSNTDVSAVTNQFIGKEFTDAVFEQLLSSLFSLDYFKDIETDIVPLDAQGSTLMVRFTVVEYPLVSKVSFSGNSQIKNSELKDALSIKEKTIFNEAKVLLDERALRDLYLNKGYTNIRVNSQTLEQTDGSIQVVYTLTEGKQTIVTGISFEGNATFAQKSLKKEMKQKEKTLFEKGIFQEAYVELDKQNLINFYNERGYIETSIVDVKRETFFNEADNRDELTLTYVIREGSQYVYKGTSITGNKLFSTEELLAKIQLKDGDVFNVIKFSAGLRAIYDTYVEKGYTSNYFAPQEYKNVEAKTVTYTIEIIEKPRSYIENIIIRGNEKTKEEVILREIPLESGDVFSQTKVYNGIRNLYNTQYFSNVLPDMQQGSEENLIDLIFEVDEQSTTSLEFGVTFSGVADPDTPPISFFSKLTDSNFMGTGRTIGAELTIADGNYTLGGTFLENWLFGKPISLFVQANLNYKTLTTFQETFFPENTNDYIMDYNELSTNLSFGLGRRWYPSFAILSFNSGFTVNLFKNFYDAESFVPLEEKVKSAYDMVGITNSFYISLSLDDRDIFYDASKGWFASQRLSWTGLIPAVETEFFLRSDTKFESYFTLLDKPVTDIWNLKFVFFAYTGLSFLVPTSNTSIANDSKLLVDGMFNGRGWNTVRNNRGNALWSTNLELRFPVAPGMLSLDAFYDIAAVKDSLQDFAHLSQDDFYYSFGAGLRISVPQFPLKFLWAFPYKYENGNFQWKNNTQFPIEFVLSFNIVNR